MVPQDHKCKPSLETTVTPQPSGSFRNNALDFYRDAGGSGHEGDALRRNTLFLVVIGKVWPRQK